MPTKADVTPRLFPLTDYPYILEGSGQHYLTSTIVHVHNDQNIQRR